MECEIAEIGILMGTSEDFTEKVEKLQDKEVEKLQDAVVEKVQGTNIESLQNSSCQMASSVTPTNHFSFPMPAFSPVINSNDQGTINFTINVCPSGNLAIGNNLEQKETTNFDELLSGIDIKDLFD